MPLDLSDDTDSLPPETIMQDAIAKGATHLQVRCHNCRQTTQMPFHMVPDMLSALRRPIGDYAGRLRCTRCKHYPPRENITAWAQSFTRQYRTRPGSP